MLPRASCRWWPPEWVLGPAPFPPTQDSSTLLVPLNLGFWHSPWQQICVSRVTWAPLPGHWLQARSLQPCLLSASSLTLSSSLLGLPGLKTKLGGGGEGVPAGKPGVGGLSNLLDSTGAEKWSLGSQNSQSTPVLFLLRCIDPFRHPDTHMRSRMDAHSPQTQPHKTQTQTHPHTG